MDLPNKYCVPIIIFRSKKNSSGESGDECEMKCEHIDYMLLVVHCIKSCLKEMEEALYKKCPEEEDMIEKLQNDGYNKEWLAECLESYNVKQDALKHFIKWFYILNYNDYKFWFEYKEAFEEENVSLVQFGAFAACIFSIPTDGTHHLPGGFKFVDLEDGLKKYEVENKQLLDCLGLLDKIRFLDCFMLEYETALENQLATI